MGKKIDYSDEKLLELMRNIYKNEGKVKCDYFKASNNLPCYGYYIKRFGSWEKAKELARVPKFNRKEKKYSKETIIHLFKGFVKNNNGKIPTVKELEKAKFPLHSIWNYFKTYDEFVLACDFVHNTTNNGKYKKEFLISEIQRFVKEFNRIPIQKDFENLKGYPSRKTFTNHFNSFNEVIRQAGYIPIKLDIKENKVKYTKEYLIKIINDYIEKYSKVPTIKELSKEVGFEVKNYYNKTFGGWNNALQELNLPLNSVSQYNDEFLHSEFDKFVKEHNRVPTYDEFNNSEYPSFWCYQNRYGSWNKAVIAYGYIPNDRNRKYYLDDGEICASSYEYDISTWLKKYNIKYNRDVDYKNFIDGYKGKMNCDYVFNCKGQKWYVEMAGFLGGTDFNKFSKEERNYFFKLMYKKKILKRQKVNYLIIYPKDLKTKKFEDIFYFLNINKDKQFNN